MNKTHSRSSDILKELFGDIKPYRDIMDEWAEKLKQQYSNRNLSTVFNSLSKHLITIMPMVFCDALTADLNKKADREILAAIGLSCLLISTHDDVVDEMPKDRVVIAKLIYGGNIAGLCGLKLLFQKKDTGLTKVLIDAISENHYLQQLVVEKLWQNKQITQKKYLEGIRHIYAFTSIGLMCALVITRNTSFRKQLQKFSVGYGITLQIIDDLREINEDRLSGYSSLPLLEGPPFKQSFKQIYHHIEVARGSLRPSWKNMRIIVDRIESFAKGLERKINGIK